MPTSNVPAASSGNSQKAAIDKLRDAAETLEKRENHLQHKIDNEITQARAYSKQGKKREALTCIKRKKMYEKQMEQLMGTKNTLETQRLALEAININKEALEASRAAAGALSSATAQMGGVDAVEDTMDQVEEGLQDAEEIGEAMSRQVATPGVDQDEDVREPSGPPPLRPPATPSTPHPPSTWQELLAELAGLEDEAANLDLGAGASSAAAKSEADEMAELAALMPSAPMPSAPTSRVMTEEVWPHRAIPPSFP